MTDLLASLVDRALDRTPVLQRRQPTPFEPMTDVSFNKQPNIENPWPVEQKGVVGENGSSFDEPSRSDNNSPPSPVPPFRHDKPEPRPLTAAPTRSRRRHDKPPPSIDDSGSLEPFTTARKDTVKTVTLGEPRREINTPTVAEPAGVAVTPTRLIETIVERRVEREIVQEHSMDQPAIKEVHTFAPPNVERKPSPEDDGAQPKQPLKAELKKVAPLKEHTVAEPSIAQKALPRDPARITRAVSRAESKDSPLQATAPVIHVTIGRVEVRATPPAGNKVRTTQPVGPKKSLEDYLRSRGEGKQ